MVKTYKAGLLLLTVLASSVPAIAQEWGGHGGGMRREGGGGGWQRGGGQQTGGGEARGWQGNGGAAPTMPQSGAHGDNSGWNGDANRQRQWQGGAPRAEAYPPQQTPVPQPNPDASARFGQRPGNGWQGGNGLNNNWHGDANRNDPGRWNGNGAWQNNPNRAYGGQPAPNRPDWTRNDRNGWSYSSRPRPNGPNGNWNNGGWNGSRLGAEQRWQDQARWNRDWRRDNRYDWSGYRQYNRDIFRLPAYRAPYGWGGGYSRFSIGVYIGSPLFGSSYWIDDPYSYRLPAAYGTLRWIRYYDDALLVDIRDGYVVDVIHDFFW